MCRAIWHTSVFLFIQVINAQTLEGNSCSRVPTSFRPDELLLWKFPSNLLLSHHSNDMLFQTYPEKWFALQRILHVSEHSPAKKQYKWWLLYNFHLKFRVSQSACVCSRCAFFQQQSLARYHSNSSNHFRSKANNESAETFNNCLVYSVCSIRRR